MSPESEASCLSFGEFTHEEKGVTSDRTVWTSVLRCQFVYMDYFILC